MYLIYNDKGDIVKVLSIREPYASLIKLKIKTIETRSFKTNYRGELYIHASLSKSNVDDELSKMPMEYKCGLYEAGRYAWILESVEEIDAIKAKGKLGIWNF